MTDYPIAKKDQLEKITSELTKDTVERFYPSWWTEHWVNFRTLSEKSITFRFDRPGYIGTVIGNDDEVYCFGSEDRKQFCESVAKSNSNVEIYHKSDSNSIQKVGDILLKGKPIQSINVEKGNENTPDVVELLTNDSYGIVFFLPGTFVAVEYYEKGKEKLVFGVQGKDVSHKRLNLALSTFTGKDEIYTENNTGQIYRLPDLKNPTNKLTD